MRLALYLSREELSNLGTQILVEMWEKRLFGRVKRAWLKEFTEQERRYLGDIYKVAYRWYLVTGYPDGRTFLPSNLDLVRKGVNFFGTI